MLESITRSPHKDFQIFALIALRGRGAAICLLVFCISVSAFGAFGPLWATERSLEARYLPRAVAIIIMQIWAAAKNG